MVPRRPYTEGESLMRMVIRSTLGTAAPTTSRWPGSPASAATPTPVTRLHRAANERHLAAPTTSVQLAEWHAMFDAAIGLGAAQGDIDEQFDIAARESGSLPAAGAGRLRSFNPDPAATPTDLTTLEKGGPAAAGRVRACTTPTTWLCPTCPTRSSAGASFTTLPGDRPDPA